MPLPLTHIALHVSNLEACVDFYQDYCGLITVHERPHKKGRIVWLACPGHENDFVIVMIPGGEKRNQDKMDFSHLGFAVDSEGMVDELASRAEKDGCLLWKPRQDPFPAGYYCGIYDPDGNAVEFSFGQPLGPGSQKFPTSPS